jgi:hypothetical protein
MINAFLLESAFMTVLIWHSSTCLIPAITNDILNVCGHDYASFWSLIELFEPIYDSPFPNKSAEFRQLVATTSTGKRKGRPPHLDAAGCLGLDLAWYCTRGGAVSRTLCIMFGLTLLVMLWSLKFSKRVLLCIHQSHPDARIQKPSAAKLLSCSHQ